MRRLLLKLLTISAAAALHMSAAWASDICVMCTQPAMTYVCRATASPEHNVFLHNRRLVQLACIQRLAKSNGHGSCSANQKGIQACTGQLVTIDLTDMARQYTHRLPKPLRQENVTIVQPSPPSDSQTESEQEPKTVVEIAKRTVQGSKKQLDKAGQTVKKVGKAVGDGAQKIGEVVGDGAKQTWQCLSSLFSEC